MKILALETSGKTFSVALVEDKIVKIFNYFDYNHMHSEMIVLLVERMLKDYNITYKDIDKFAVCMGPGSFTGIRVAMTVVKILSQVLKKPVVSVDSLTILENSFPKIKGYKIIAAIDALRNEVYVKKNGKVVIEKIESFIKRNKKYKNKIIVAGSAAIVYKDLIKKYLGKGSVVLPLKSNMVRADILGILADDMEGESYLKIAPLYLRKSWAEESKSRTLKR